MSEATAGRALVVEDDAAIRELLHLHLGLSGYAVEEALNGRDALDRARREAFDLLPVGDRRSQKKSGKKGKSKGGTKPGGLDSNAKPL